MSSPTGSQGPIDTLRSLVTVIQERQITFLAASLTYYAFSSLIPLLLLVISIAALVGGASLQQRIIEAAGGSLPPSIGNIITNTIQNTGAAGLSIGIGLVVLVWSAIKIFRGMDIAFSQVYGDPGPDGIVDQVKNALITLVAVIFAVAVTIVIGAVVSFVESTPILGQFGLAFLQDAIGFLGGVISIISIAIAFLPLYYFLPTADIPIREAIPGAVFGAVGWTALQTGFRIYTAQSGSSAYGLIGAALLILTFLYFGGIILLIGVALNAVLAGRAFSNAEETNDNDDDEDRSEGETNRKDGGLRGRVKERTKSVLDEHDREREATGDPDAEADRDAERDRAITDGGRPETGRLVTDGGVERTAGNTDSGDAGFDFEADAEATAGERPGAEAATAMDGTEYTLGEEYTLQREIERLRAELDAFELEVDERVVDREDLESELESYVRSQVRSGKARGWGPYLVLLYGTIMTLAIALGDALTGGWAVLAIAVIFLSTLGLYAIMVVVGLGLNALSIPGRLRRAVQSRRS
jgi:membrane protein